LEIYADDVKCSHGAAIGQLDEDAIFYLRTRGISRQAAQRVLTRAFAGEVVERIHIEPLRTAIEAQVEQCLERIAASLE
jgi:Fe-S cluster assembly protein SufD